MGHLGDVRPSLFAVGGSASREAVIADLPEFISDAANFLQDINPYLSQAFLATRLEGSQNTIHFLQIIQVWIRQNAYVVTPEHEDNKYSISRITEMRRMYVQDERITPLFLSISEYTTRDGRQGFAVVVKELDQDEKSIHAKAKSTFMTEQDNEGGWDIITNLPSDEFSRMDLLSAVTDEVHEIGVIILPGSNTGDGRRGELAA